MWLLTLAFGLHVCCKCKCKFNCNIATRKGLCIHVKYKIDFFFLKMWFYKAFNSESFFIDEGKVLGGVVDRFQGSLLGMLWSRLRGVVEVLFIIVFFIFCLDGRMEGRKDGRYLLYSGRAVGFHLD